MSLVYLYLVGVINDGSKTDERCAPDNPRRAIRYVRETSLTVSVRVLYPSGVAVDLSAAEVSLHVRSLAGCSGDTLVLLGTIVESDVAFELEPVTFRDWLIGHHAYDVRVAIGSAVYAAIPTSPFIIEP
jgi:hypothetical protein